MIVSRIYTVALVTASAECPRGAGLVYWSVGAPDRRASNSAVKLGILDNFPRDHEVVLDRGTDCQRFRRLFAAAGAAFAYEEYVTTAGELPRDPGECDAYVLTGSPAGAYDTDPWIVALTRFVRDAADAGACMVGVCFGHQLLAQALGGEVRKSEKGWGLGRRGFEIAVRKPWMDPWRRYCELYFSHQDQVMKVPPGAEILAGTSFCEVTMFCIDDRVLGVQAHPELDRDDIERLIELHRPAAAKDIVASALHSLNHGDTDQAAFCRWMVNFLTK